MWIFFNWKWNELQKAEKIILKAGRIINRHVFFPSRLCIDLESSLALSHEAEVYSADHGTQDCSLVHYFVADRGFLSFYQFYKAYNAKIIKCCGCTRDRTHSIVACANHGHCWLLREDAGFGSLHCSVLPRRRMPAVVFNVEMLQSSLVARADGSLMYQSSRMVADVREVKRSPVFVTRSVRSLVLHPLG